MDTRHGLRKPVKSEVPTIICGCTERRDEMGEQPGLARYDGELKGLQTECLCFIVVRCCPIFPSVKIAGEHNFYLKFKMYRNHCCFIQQ